MNTILSSARTVLFSLLMLPLATQAAEPTPPAGFRALFNGKDLAGWYGLNPHSVDKLTGEKLDAALQKMRDEFPTNWRVDDGELVNDGHGPYATTDTELGDLEFLIEYKTVAKADSGIYLRGLPQVQICHTDHRVNPLLDFLGQIIDHNGSGRWDSIVVSQRCGDGFFTNCFKESSAARNVFAIDVRLHQFLNESWHHNDEVLDA